MGRLALVDMLDQPEHRRIVLEWHLQYNHYPPHPKWMVDVALAAIEACEQDDPERVIPLPEGVVHKRYGASVPAAHLIESLHLGEFLEADRG